MDVSTLSRLEAGKRRLGLEHLPGLAAALGVTTDELLEPPSHQDPRVRARSRTNAGLTLRPLTRDPARGLHAYQVSISPTRTVVPEELPVHEGQEWMYVLSGRLRLILGDDDLVIEPGEAVEFSTWTPHWFGAIDGPVKTIAIFGPNGERLHFHT